VIVVDSSALMAIVLDEPEAGRCMAALEAEPGLCICAATLAEAMIVASRRRVDQPMRRLLDGLGLEIVAVSPARARRVAAAYGRRGKGVHPAGLNFGDCFAYALAEERVCALLFVGDGFSRTDVARAGRGEAMLSPLHMHPPDQCARFPPDRLKLFVNEAPQHPDRLSCDLVQELHELLLGLGIHAVE